VSEDNPTDLSHGDGSEQHFVNLLALHMWPDPAGPRGRSRVRPSMWVPGTERPRLGVFATMVDMIGGLLPEGLVTPTIDLRISVVDELPSAGVVDLETTTLKLGRRLLVSETLLRSEGRLFARGSTTFLSDVKPDHGLYRDNPEPEVDIESFDALMAPAVVDATTLLLVPRPGLNNGMRHTVQGGVQATFCELVAEHALGGDAEIIDIDVRYLRSMKTGPMHGTAEVLGNAQGQVSVRVLLTDVGADNRLVSYAAISARA
jgi:acyl-coenzyme A thioesterase PaaI-like protein